MMEYLLNPYQIIKYLMVSHGHGNPKVSFEILD